MIAGIVLAAGESRRMGRSKPLVRAKRQSFLATAIRLLWTRCDSVIVVLGKQAGKVRDAAEAEFAQLAESGALNLDLLVAQRRPPSRGLQVQFVENPRFRRGMYESARLGLATALLLKPRALFVMPVDHPRVSSQTVAVLATAMEQALGAFGRHPAPKGKSSKATARDGLAYAIVPRCQGRRGHPVVLSPALARAVSRDRAAHDLSDALRRNARLVGYLDVKDPGILHNVNHGRA